jgi:prevent-host-death family protein
LPTQSNYHDYHDHFDDKGVMGMGSRTWTVAEAKAKLSAVMESALTDGPQSITRRGRPSVVVVAADEWEKKTKRKGNLAEFFAASPLRASGIRIRRAPIRLRRGL